MSKKIPEPEDLGLKVGTEEEAAWTEIKKGAEKEISHMRRSILVNEEIIKLSEKIIKEEKGKWLTP